MLAAKDESAETKDVAGGSKKRKVTGSKSDGPTKKQARKSATSKEDSETSITTKDKGPYDHGGTAQARESAQDDSLIFSGIKRIFSNERPLTF